MPVSLEKSHEKRLTEWKKWLENFKKQTPATTSVPEFEYIPNAAWLLNDLYWRLAEQYLRPVLTKPKDGNERPRIHHYKIISASEITVMMVLPIKLKTLEENKKGVIEDDQKQLNDDRQRQLNALLAWFVATQILEGWEIENGAKISAVEIATIAAYTEAISHDANYPESFAAEHIKWLKNLNVVVEKPLLLNAQCWRLFYIACLENAKKNLINN